MSTDVKRFVSVPVEIEAVEFKGISNATDIIDWVLSQDGTARYHSEERRGQTSYRPEDVQIILEHLQIETLEGTMKANVGDWIIRGTEGEFYPCKPSVFQRKYTNKEN